jgi:hypothetical protein
MKILTLTCNQCGAPLEVPAKTRFLTCTFCSSQLEVHRSGNAAYTEVLEAVQKRTEEVADDVETIELKLELEKLDREWKEERKRHLFQNSVPTKGTAAGLAVFGVVIGIACIGVGVAGAGWEAIFMGLGMFVGLAIMAAICHAKAERYNSAKQRFEDQRRELLQKIEPSSDS